MTFTTIRRVQLALLATMALSSAGCSTACGPGFGNWLLPMPVSPYTQKQQEDNYWNKERYDRVPVLGAITTGTEIVALDPPTPDEVMRALEKANGVQGGLPFLHEIQRNNVRMTVDPIADYVDPPRFFPLIGMAQLHHAHYKCTIYYTEVTRVGWPVPYTTVDEDAAEVIYIDHEHFHVVGNVDGGVGSNY